MCSFHSDMDVFGNLSGREDGSGVCFMPWSMK